MEKAKKILRNLIIFIILIVLTFYIVFKERSLSDIITTVSGVKKEFIFIAFICMCLYFVCDAINIRRALKVLKEKTTFLKSLKYSLIGFFFSAITPAASGGQPMQIYYMYKDKIRVANSTLTLLINLSCVQIVTLSIAFISLFFNYKYLNNSLIWLFVLGVTLNLMALALLLVSILSKRMTKTLINLAVKVLKFFRVKNIQNKQEKLESELTKYHDSAVYIKNHKLMVLKTLITTYIQFLLFYSISYWVYRSFGLSEYNILEITTMQAVLYATVSGIPSPGAVGVSEGGFIGIFSKIFSETNIHSAMLLNRGINFYLFVMISAIVVIINTIIKKKDDINIKEEKME